MEDCVALAHRAGERIWREARVPVYFLRSGGGRPDRVKLEDVRRGGFWGLQSQIKTDPAKRPDIGGPGLHPTAGATIVGARKFLIAYNMNLATEELSIAHTEELSIAQEIARKIRASNGGFPAVKALGLPLESRKQVQVSVNLTDFEITPLHVVSNEVARLAAERGVEIAGSELIGLMPRQAMEQAAAELLRLRHFDSSRVVENRVEGLLRS